MLKSYCSKERNGLFISWILVNRGPIIEFLWCNSTSNGITFKSIGYFQSEVEHILFLFLNETTPHLEHFSYLTDRHLIHFWHSSSGTNKYIQIYCLKFLHKSSLSSSSSYTFQSMHCHSGIYKPRWAWILFFFAINYRVSNQECKTNKDTLVSAIGHSFA